MRPWIVTFLTPILVAAGISAQTAEPPATTPIYRVTVVGRTIKAINYGHRSIPTKIDFRGTVLEPEARGEATVESKRGATAIDARFERLPAANKFGPQYLTYVLWAITPEGRAVNLGELVLNPSNKGKLEVTTEFQAFGLMVTAEPHYAVVQPGDVVVLENALRPDTVGRVQEINAKYELLSRGAYTYEKRSGAPPAEEKKLSMSRYEAVLQIYQARNAVQLAKAEGAGRVARDSMQNAEMLLQQAEELQAQKGDAKRIVTLAREATQAAQDARLIAAKRLEQKRHASDLPAQARIEGLAPAGEAPAAADPEPAAPDRE